MICTPAALEEGFVPPRIKMLSSVGSSYTGIIIGTLIIIPYYSIIIIFHIIIFFILLRRRRLAIPINQIIYNNSVIS